jgi:hypothetical protein
VIEVHVKAPFANETQDTNTGFIAGRWFGNAQRLGR